MALIEKISQMKQQGITDPEIIRTLREEGGSPREIQEAMSQSEIKSAVSSEQGEMQQSIMSGSGENVAAPPEATPAAAVAAPVAPAPAPAPQAAQPAAAYPPQEANQGTYQDPGAYQDQGVDQGAYQDQGYADQGAYYQQAMDAETIREIASQVTEEALNKLKTQITEITRLKTELKFQIQNLDNRLTKIETTISQLQSDILKKIGDYGENIENISKEMRATQDSFSKLVNPTMDRKRAAKTTNSVAKAAPKKTSKKAAPKTTSKKSASDSGASFEDYFR